MIFHPLSEYSVPYSLLVNLVAMAFLTWKTIATLIIVLLVSFTVRLLSVLPSRRPKATPRKRGSPVHLLIILGSGGHTAEMISMLDKATTPFSQTSPTQTFDWTAITHRTWIVSSGDSFSATRAEQFEAAHEASSGKSKSNSSNKSPKSSTYSIISVPRARKIHQPLLTTPISALQCLWTCLLLLVKSEHGYPDLILANGPATATILVFASVLLRFFDFKGVNSRGKMRTIYVESWARVKKLSLSGRLLCFVADRVLVQWEQLHGVQGRGEYLGVLV